MYIFYRIGNTAYEAARLITSIGGKNMVMDRIAMIIAIIGALNWGSVGLFKFDIVAWICGGQTSLAARIIYTVVALAGLWCISLLFRSRDDEIEETSVQ